MVSFDVVSLHTNVDEDEDIEDASELFYNGNILTEPPVAMDTFKILAKLCT